MMPFGLSVFALMVAWLPFCLPCSMFLKASCFNQARPRLVILSLWPVGINWNRFLSAQELREVSLCEAIPDMHVGAAVPFLWSEQYKAFF